MTKIQDLLLEEEARVPTGARWYVVMTHPRKERFAIANLEKQSFEIFLPEIVKRVKHNRKTVDRLAPFFPRYLFIRLDLWQDRWRSVLGSFGVTTLVMEQGRPRAVPRGLVETMMVAIDPVDKGITFRHGLEEGQTVQFKSGPFAEVLGQLESLDDNGRVAVLLEMLGARRIVMADAQDLIPQQE